MVESGSAALTRILDRLQAAKKEPSGSWTARCPAHADGTPSLSIRLGQEGRVLLHCHAGCAVENVVQAIGLEMSELFPDGPAGNGRRKTIAEYAYEDEDGQILYQVVRYFPKDFRQRRPDGRGGWIWSLGDLRRVLYRLPDVVEAVSLGKAIYLVEGEKDADALAELGFVATTNAGGAGKWSRDYHGPLRDARVVILPDNDEVGRNHAERIAAELDQVCADVRVVHLPGLPEKGDVSDWLNAGGSRELLEQLAAGADPHEEAERVFRTLEELLADPELLKPPECVVPRLAYRARATALCAPDKAGKSTLMAHAMARLSRCHTFLGQRINARHGRAVLLGLEEALGDEVRRLHDLQADPTAIQIVTMADQDLFESTDRLLAEWPADLVVVDSLMEYARVTLGSVPDNGDAGGWAAVVRPLVALARKHDTALVILHHVRRSDGQYLASNQIAASVDALFEMAMPGKSEDPRWRHLTGRGRWPIEPFTIALTNGHYELASEGDLSAEALILLHVEQHPGCSLRDVRDAVSGRQTTIRSVIGELVERGALVNRGDEARWALYVGAHVEAAA